MKIAVVGTGISGMVAAYLLHGQHDLAVFEAEGRIGGHTHTHDIDLAGRRYAVDTGFIVFNEQTYPNFVRLLRRLGVRWKPSRMSFSVRCDRTGLEYSPQSPAALFAQPRNLLRPAFHRMLLEVFRFRRESEALVQKDDLHTTLGEFLRAGRYSPMFVDHFIVPMGAAIWSADPERFEDFPAAYFARFFKNHGFLRVRDQPRWLVIEGGSRKYVEALTRPFRDRIRLETPVLSITRLANGVEIRARGAEPERFDRAIIATHSDQALAMLTDPQDAEREILGAVPYQENFTVLHTDPSWLPRRRIAWAGWNYIVPRKGLGRVSLTYNMNILQGLTTQVPLCVTLNPSRAVAPSHVLRTMDYQHPVYTERGLAAQKRWHEINGRRHTYFCGAYWGYGFHEDGVNSALAVAHDFGKGL